MVLPGSKHIRDGKVIPARLPYPSNLAEKIQPINKQYFAMYHINELLEENIFSMNSESYVPSQPIEYDWIRDHKKYSPRLSGYVGRESDEHIRMKIVGADYLENHRNIELKKIWNPSGRNPKRPWLYADMEIKVDIGYYDVGNKSEGVFVEAGYVNANKILKSFGIDYRYSTDAYYFPENVVNELILIPYSDSDEFDVHRMKLVGDPLIRDDITLTSR